MRACVQSAQTLGGNNPTTETGKGPEQNLTKMPHITCQLSWVLTAQTEGAFGVMGTGSSYFSHRMPEKGVLYFLEITPQKRGIVKRSWRDYAPALFERRETEENRVFGSGAFGFSRDMSLSWDAPPSCRPGDHALPEGGERHVGHSRSLALGKEAAGDPRLPPGLAN